MNLYCPDCLKPLDVNDKGAFCPDFDYCGFEFYHDEGGPGDPLDYPAYLAASLAVQNMQIKLLQDRLAHACTKRDEIRKKIEKTKKTTCPA